MSDNLKPSYVIGALKLNLISIIIIIIIIVIIVIIFMI